MCPEPLVSIVTPAYNAARFLEESLRSAQQQTFPNWEMLVVDDGSTDDTPEIVRRWAEADPRFRLLAGAGNRGPAAARNVALESARGRYVAFLDSDDLWLPRKLEVQLEFMRARDAVFSFTAYSYIDENGVRTGRVVTPPERIDYRGLLKNTIIGCLTVMLDRTRLGPLRMPDLRQHEDIVLWLQILKGGITALGIPEELARYRLVRGSLSRNKVRSALRMWRIYRRHEHLPLPDAAWCYAHYAWNAFRKYRA
jgi:teichuronic acid biosynthesis glycosyltransferase TuaG